MTSTRRVSVVPGRGTSQLNFSCLSRKASAKLPAVVSQDRRLPALAKARSERVEDASLAGIFCKTPIARHSLTELRNELNTLQFIWQGGNTSLSVYGLVSWCGL